MMRARVIAGLFTCAGVLASLATSLSCVEEPVPTVVDAGGVIAIALMKSLTGTEGAVGRPLKDAAQVAEWQLNAGGGVLGQQVRLEIKDDGPEIPAALARADEVISSGLKIAIGPTASPEAVLMVPKLVQ